MGFRVWGVGRSVSTGVEKRGRGSGSGVPNLGMVGVKSLGFGG